MSHVLGAHARWGMDVIEQRRSKSRFSDLRWLARVAWRRGQIRFLGKFLRDRHDFLEQGGKITDLYPILNEHLETAGSANGHYFHQDLLVAQLIHRAQPQRHIDVGSRVDGFVAHVATFRQIDVIDIRPMPVSEHSNIRFIQADLAQGGADLAGCSDSVSCLHVLEHFGLGRYGDRVDPEGHRKGIGALVRMVKDQGTLYLSSPIGRPRVCFNAHRVFHPHDFPMWLAPSMELIRFDYVDDEGALHQNAGLNDVPQLEYGCGIYTFRKRVIRGDS